jgi:hypothetical protein
MRLIMIMAHTDKHYVYALAYPDDYPDSLKAGTVFYVGKGKNDRVYQHSWEAKQAKKSHKCNVIRLIWSHGREVKITVLAYFDTHKQACSYEIALIFLLPDLTNKTIGGDGRNGDKHSIATRQKMSDTHKKRFLSLELRQKRSEQLKGNKSRIGQHLSLEQRKMISSVHKGKQVSAETRQKQSKALKGRIMSPEARQKMSDAKKGRTLSPEHRAKIGLAGRGNKNASKIKQELAQSNGHIAGGN